MVKQFVKRIIGNVKKTNLSLESVWTAAGITQPIYPEWATPGLHYDKWGHHHHSRPRTYCWAAYRRWCQKNINTSWTLLEDQNTNR